VRQADHDPFSIESHHAFIACTDAACWKCKSEIPVICIYVRQGRVDGDDLANFTVSNVTRIDDDLKAALGRFETFREAYAPILGMARWRMENAF
jgi:hypothetical protein